MPWVPIHLGPHPYELNVVDGEGSVTDSTVTIDTSLTGSSVWGGAIEGDALRVRITPLAYSAVGGAGGSIYWPATLDVESLDPSYYQIINEAPPYPAENFPPGPEGVTSWQNDLLADIQGTGFLYLNYHIATFTGDGLPMYEQAQFLVEVWDDQGSSGCFWTDLEGVTETCGSGGGPAGTADAVMRSDYAFVLDWEWFENVAYVGPDEPYEYPPPTAVEFSEAGFTFGADPAPSLVFDSDNGTLSTTEPHETGSHPNGYSARWIGSGFDSDDVFESLRPAPPYPLDAVPLRQDPMTGRTDVTVLTGTITPFGMISPAVGATFGFAFEGSGLGEPTFTLYNSTTVVEERGDIPRRSWYETPGQIELLFNINSGGNPNGIPSSFECELMLSFELAHQAHVDAVLTEGEWFETSYEEISNPTFEVPGGGGIPTGDGYIHDYNGSTDYITVPPSRPPGAPPGPGFVVANLRRVVAGVPQEPIARVKVYYYGEG